MPMRGPTIAELRTLAQSYGLHCDDDELGKYCALIAAQADSYARLEQLAEPTLPVRIPRDPGYRPAPEDNPLGAWYWRCEIKGAEGGPLSRKRVAIKDNVCVAGIPMMNGTAVLEGFVPVVDATVVTRLLDAGATILGKAVCEGLCLSGGSHTADTGFVRNPHDRSRSTGGSSSGSAALVAAGEVDMAIGGDQGGSIRIPAAWCGIFGLKPTWGLVPYTGAFPIELTLDHLGPMAATAADCALMLEAIAGPDGLDPRQHAGLKKQPYVAALTGDARGLRLGVLAEGFGLKPSEPEVDECVREAVRRFEKLGAKVSEVSVAWHREGGAIWSAIGAGAVAIFEGNSTGTNWKGYYNTGLLDAFARGRTARSNDLPETAKYFVLHGRWMQERYHGRYYAKAQNLARRLTAAYDEALKECDLLVMPTLAMKAPPLPTSRTRDEYFVRAYEMIGNTAQFDVTGHPAMNVPCGKSAGLPIGMMLVGRIGEDTTVLRAADAFDQSK